MDVGGSLITSGDTDVWDGHGGHVVVVCCSLCAPQGDVVEMGNFFNTFCFGNDPFECEFVYDGAEILHEGEFKCQICDIDGVRQASGTDDDLLV